MFLSVLCFFLSMSSWAQPIPVHLVAEYNWYPYSSNQVANKPGYAYELVKLVFQKIHALHGNRYAVKLSYDTFENCYFRTLSAEVDGCFNTAKLAGNEHLFHFPKTPLFSEDVVLFQRRSSKAVSVQNMEDLENERLSVGYARDHQYGRDFDTNRQIHKVPFARNSLGLKNLQHCTGGHERATKSTGVLKSCPINSFLIYKNVAEVIFLLFSGLNRNDFQRSESLKSIDFYVAFSRDAKGKVSAKIKKLSRDFDEALKGIFSEGSRGHLAYKKLQVKYFGKQWSKQHN